MMFTNPEYLWLLIPLFLVLWILIRKDFIPIDHDLKENRHFMRRRRGLKRFMLLTRFIIFALLIVLFAKPYIEHQIGTRGSPSLTLLIDNSTSMDALDTSFLDEFKQALESRVPTQVRSITSNPLISDIGGGLVSHLERDSTIIMVSDLQSTEGIPLEDAFQHAALLNASVGAIKLEPVMEDASVWIEGPRKVTRNQEVTFTVHVNKLQLEQYNLLVTINGEAVYSGLETRSRVSITKTLTEGEYTITAELLLDDDIAENNKFYKAVRVVPQPKILYVTRTNSQLPALLREQYDIRTAESIPNNLDEYYAVIIEDMNAQQIGSIDVLAEFVSEGNGLFVIGGMNSFDRGGYRGTDFETLLPVTIGRGEKRQGNSNIVILIDVSGTTQSIVRFDPVTRQFVEVSSDYALDTSKALAVDVVDTLNRGNRVGAIAFAVIDPAVSEDRTFRAVKLADLEPLSMNREKIIDRISRIDGTGQTLFDVGLSGAYAMLRGESGSRNVIMISDGGRGIYKGVKDNALNIAQRMAQENIKIYTVGVNRGINDDFLQDLAQVGGGLYFPAGTENRLKILFGTPEEKGQGDEMTLFVLNPNHFVTRDLEPDARVFGFNQVIPRSLARTLVTTDSGEPALTEWRYGLGRVSTLTVFSGSAGLGELLSGDNSLLLTRTINYAIGNPERKLPYSVTIPDTFVNEPVRIQVISDEYPRAGNISLSKVNEREYTGRTFPGPEGFNELLDTTYAVNYPKELQRLGMNPRAEELLGIAGGTLFSPNDIEEIVQYVRDTARTTQITKEYIIWQILIIILILYLFEIVIRKVMENKKKI